VIERGRCCKMKKERKCAQVREREIVVVLKGCTDVEGNTKEVCVCVRVCVYSQGV
jgi:hypothetical protein